MSTANDATVRSDPVMQWARTVVLMGLALPPPIVACTTVPSQPAFTTPPGPARHAIHSEQLRAIMARLGDDVAKTWPQEIEDQRAILAARDRASNLRRAAELATLLADAAEAISFAVEDAALTQDERDRFQMQVQMLRRRARELGVSARARNSERMHQALRQIDITCHGCHTQFRDQAGPLFWGLSQS